MNELFSGLMLGTSIAAMTIGASTAADSEKTVHIGLPQDWSGQYLQIRHPVTPEEAARQGRSAQWQREYSDPRYLLALARRLQNEAARRDTQAAKRNTSTARAAPLYRDWRHALGGAGGVGTPGVYPAKYSFDIFAPPSCDNDFVVYTTGTAGATASGSIETRLGTFAANPGANGTVRFNSGANGREVILTSSTISNTGLNFQVANGDPSGNATNLADAANRWSGTTGISASAAANVVTFSNNTAGATSVPVSKTGLAGLTFSAGAAGSGTPGQPTVVAFNHLYNGSCDGSRSHPDYPDVFWSYNTGDGVVTETSPVISYFDGGQQIAFVQRASGPIRAQLVLLKWSSTASVGSIGAPTVPTLEAPANYRTCTAPCMTVMDFSGDRDNRVSSPFVDYFSDTLWVGDAVGRLHKFTGIFGGTPAEVTTGGFPADVAITGPSGGRALSSPVFAFGSNQVLVGSASGGINSGGRLHRIDADDGTVVSSAKLSANNNIGLRASPLVDVTSGNAYAFVQEDGVNHADCSDANCRAVIQLPVAFAAGDAGNKVRIGRSLGGGRVQFNGSFDDVWHNSPTPAGNMYVCGSDGADQNLFRLWQIPINPDGSLGVPVAGPTLTTTGGGNDCSPVTGIQNGASFYLYASVPNQSVAGGSCTNQNNPRGGCLYLFNMNGPDPWGTALPPTAQLQVMGGASGVIMDNVSNQAGAGQVYFSSLSNAPGAAMQASQAGLQ